jgi:hypothetical protein
MVSINYLAVLVSAVASMVIGSIWYGPLFGKKFIQASGMDTWSPEKKEAEKKKMGLTYSIQFIASLVMFCSVAKFMGGLGQMTVGGGLMVAFWVWLGFVVPVKLGDAIWGGNMTMFWLGAGNMLLTLLATGAIIGAWK